MQLQWEIPTLLLTFVILMNEKNNFKCFGNNLAIIWKAELLQMSGVMVKEDILLWQCLFEILLKKLKNSVNLRHEFLQKIGYAFSFGQKILLPNQQCNI